MIITIINIFIQPNLTRVLQSPNTQSAFKKKEEEDKKDKEFKVHKWQYIKAKGRGQKAWKSEQTAYCQSLFAWLVVPTLPPL